MVNELSPSAGPIEFPRYAQPRAKKNKDIEVTGNVQAKYSCCIRRCVKETGVGQPV